MNFSSPNRLCDMITTKTTVILGCVVYLLFLPVLLSVALVGYKKWKKQGSVSHSDAINYHMVALEMARIFGVCSYSYGMFGQNKDMGDVGSFLVNLSSAGQLLFHCLTCAERYLAAVHPITYLHLKKSSGVTIRNISIVITWLCVLGQVIVRLKVSVVYYMVVACLLAFNALVLVTFFSVSVLCVLIGPRPGERGGDVRRIDQSKRWAINMMLAILGTLLVRFVVLVIHYILSLMSPAWVDICVLRVIVPWFEIPSSLVLPLFFLHREGKLRLCTEHVVQTDVQA